MSGSHVPGGPGNERHSKHNVLLSLAGNVASDQGQQEDGDTTGTRLSIRIVFERV